MAAREYVGGRGPIAEALRHAAAALRELGDEDIATRVEAEAGACAQRARDEIAREIQVLPHEEKKP